MNGVSIALASFLVGERIEDLRKQGLNLVPRVNAIQALTRTMIAMICSFDNQPELKKRLEEDVFPLILEEARNRDYGKTRPELAKWFVDRELKILQYELRRILEEIEKVRTTAKRQIN